MNIGFITTWFERGAAYVTKQYAELLEKKGHKVFIYARGERYAVGNPKWDKENVLWGKKLYDTNLDYRYVAKWIANNKIECLFFNEQRDIKSVIRLKLVYPQLKIGTYIDYYTQSTVDDFAIYDFLICNTKRHYSVFSKFKQCYYIPWGTDVRLYDYKKSRAEKVRFFHSAGMSNRKGTDVLIDAFINGKLYEEAELIIHTQVPLSDLIGRKIDNLEKFGITVIEKTVSAPGLYYMGDVYVYPTTLDGLGLTMYEALASGMPVIATDCAPMNEVITEEVGRLVKVDEYRCRWDAYYWPLAFVNENSLIAAMNFYVENKNNLLQYRDVARKKAEDLWDWDSRIDLVSDAFTNSNVKEVDSEQLKNKIRIQSKKEMKQLFKNVIPFTPKGIQQIIFRNR